MSTLHSRLIALHLSGTMPSREIVQPTKRSHWPVIIAAQLVLLALILKGVL